MMKITSRLITPANHLFLIVITTVSFLLSLTGCEKNAPIQEEIIKKQDTYLCPPVPQGQITVIGHETRSKPFLGAGYDIMGDFLSNNSVKDLILDLNKIPDDEITRIKAFASFGKGYEGRDITDFLTSMQEKNDFIPFGGNMKEQLFTGTIHNQLRFTDPDEYSSHYTFVCEEGTWTEEIQRLHMLRIKDFLPYLSDQFKDDMIQLSPEWLIEKYGTHMMKTVFLGSRIRTLYRSVVANDKKHYAETAYNGLSARQKQIYKKPNLTTFEPEEEVARNHGGTIFVECFGGDNSTIPFLTLTPNAVIGEPMDLTKWKTSLDSTNMSLSELSAEHLLPLSDLITDPIKKEQVENAIRKYISSKQLKIKKTASLFQASNGMHHKYYVSYDDFLTQTNHSWTCEAPLGYIYQQPQSETVPLYQYSNPENDRFSLEVLDVEEMEYKRIAGYVYSKYKEGLIGVYEIWNGLDYAYTTEDKKAYGENGSWKQTGMTFYIKKISI